MTLKQNKIAWSDLVSVKTKEVLSHHGELISVTKQGLTVQSKKEFLNISENDFCKFLNRPVELFLSQYEISFYGIIKKVNLIRRNIFEIKISFTEDTPIYYRECVTDLLN
ncbi:MAG: hypothetical protein OXN83_04720 [Oligoflexia bacterium]|nr:hypothetical protein [Oligoflexia bacterium]